MYLSAGCASNLQRFTTIGAKLRVVVINRSTCTGDFRVIVKPLFNACGICLNSRANILCKLIHNRGELTVDIARNILRKRKKSQANTKGNARNPDETQRKKVAVKISHIAKTDNGKGKATNEKGKTDDSKDDFCFFIGCHVRNKLLIFLDYIIYRN